MTAIIIFCTLVILGTLLLLLAVFRRNAKQESVISKYLLSDFEKGKVRIRHTVLPDKRLKKNEWYRHISDLRNGRK